MQTILILGAGSDIAKAVAREFAKHRYAVQLAGRGVDELERLKNDLTTRYGTTASVHYFDAVDYASHAAFISSLPVIPDIVIYAVGYLGYQAAAQNEWKIASQIIETNYTGAVHLLNKFAGIFEDRGSGTLIGISSVAGDRGRQSNYIYGSAKAAFSAYLSGLRNRLYKKGVHVITVKPGFVYSKMTEHLKLPPMLTASTSEVADKVYKAVIKKRDIVYVRVAWRWIMLCIKLIPEPVFKRGNL